jgi:ABC-type nickel/cobalt efflux system permease component RcnA
MQVTRNAELQAHLRAGFACLAVLALAASVWIADPAAALAQASPFGIPGPRPAEPPAASGGIGTWLLMQQAEFHRALTRALGTLRESQTGIPTLFGIAFAYGVVHAVGPGHGKAVIASYIVANEATLRRGILLSFAAAGVQALVGLAAVGIIILALGGTARNMEGALLWIERIGFLLIALVGLSILWRRLRLMFASTTSDPHCGPLKIADHHAAPKCVRPLLRLPMMRQ